MNTLYTLSIIVIILVAALWVFTKYKEITAKTTSVEYIKKEALLSPAEINFYKAFLSYKKDDNPIFVKIRLADIFTPSAKGKEYISAFNKIKAKHVDFLVCDSKTFAPLYAIELDDKSHIGEKAKKNDSFKDKLFLNAGIKLFRVTAKSKYTEEHLSAIVNFKQETAQEAEVNYNF